ncbi:MFS transporter [Lactobacillus kitasatonis]|uniref:MFS transporter n=1 Tax=Lactobacillus kitasatonis TaxID=237446 RepID=A0ABS1LV34_9LACO|nr:MFS transporter [Lactobacillus kitasatonis]MBL1072122.1 MFS transporter [Lactobacillus kitasatonis]
MLKKKSYFFSRAVGGLANSLFSMVFIWWLQTSTKSSFVVGIAEAIFSTTAALSIFYGPIIDHYSFKRTSYYSILVQTVFLFATTIAVYQLSKSYILALICAGVVSVCDEFFNPADRAILKETTADDQELNNLISKVSSIDQFVNIAGTVFSGLLLTWLISANVMLICSLLSLISLVFLFYALKKVKNRVPAQEAKPKYYKQIFSGYQFIKNNYFLNHYFWSSILYSFVTPAMTILLPRIAQRSGKASFYSMFYICFMLGFIIGAAIAGKLAVQIKTIGFTWIISATPLILMIFFSNNWLIFMGLIFLFGLMTSIHNILAESMIQITSNDEVLGRVLTTIRTSTSIGGPISSIAAGILLDNSGETVLILACGFIILVSGFNIFRAIGKTA